MFITLQNSDSFTGNISNVLFVKPAFPTGNIDFKYPIFRNTLETIELGFYSALICKFYMPLKVIFTFRGMFVFYPIFSPSSFHFPLIPETKGA